MPNIIEKIYYALYDEDKLLNPFETFEINRIYEEVYEKYIEPRSVKSYDEGEEMQEVICKLCTAERKTAFKIGFQTALDIVLSR